MNVIIVKQKEKIIERENAERERLQSMSERELLIEVIAELKKLNMQCEDIRRKIVIWSN